MKANLNRRARHIVLRGDEGDMLPDALVKALAEHGVSRGFVRATGVMTDVELSAFDAEARTLSLPRRFAGPLHAVTLDATIDEGALGLRAVFARATDRGLETIAGDVSRARVVTFEALVTALDAVEGGEPGEDLPRFEVSPPRARESSPRAAESSPRAFEEPSPRVERVERVESERKASTGTAMPTRPMTKRAPEEDNSPLPEEGDYVEHFAFGPCDVIKSEGDRIYLRMQRDGRNKEIAVAMLKVTPMGVTDSGKRKYKLDRKL